MADEGTTIDWGDGTKTEDGPAEGEVTHEYDKSLDGKKQTIKVCDKANPNDCTEVTFTPGEDGGGGDGGDDGDTPTPTPTPEPEDPKPGKLKIEVEEDTTDDEHMSVTVTVDNADQGPVKVDFGDGSKPVETEQDGTEKHTYERAGEFTVTGTDLDDEGRKDSAKVTVPFKDDDGGDGGEETPTPTPEPDEPTPTPTPTPEPEEPEEPEAVKVKVVKDKDADGRMSVIATVDNGGNPATVDFGDGSKKAKNAGDGKEESKHTYKEAGDYTVTAEDAEDGSGDAAKKDTAEVTVPWQTPTPTPKPSGRRRYR